ncbi:hypothetical protein B0H14DRAFT_2629776 [Mycena olivaceomarginata]|nr:hypothetical protein B0H14DRAFT_2629776 [Mycena olivaceomarginata]
MPKPMLVLWLVKELENDPKDKTQAKDDAKAKTQPNNKTESRKRTLSTVAVADKPKKVKETKTDILISASHESDELEALLGGKGKSKVKSTTQTQRKHAAPTIDINTDDEEEPQRQQKTVHINFTNPATFSVKAKTKTTMAVSKTPKTPVAPGGPLAMLSSHFLMQVKAVKPTVALKPAKLVPDSNSESKSSDDSEEHNVSDSGAPNVEEFVIEALRISVSSGRGQSW